MAPICRLPLVLLSVTTLASCWSSSSGTAEPGDKSGPSAGSISVELASVTLGDDCGDSAPRQPPVVTAQAPSASRSAAPASPAAMAPPEDESVDANKTAATTARWACQQTSMQLVFAATDAAQPASIKIKRVELLDVKGKVLGELAARGPTRWVDDRYEPWDQAIAPGAHLATSYLLSTPDWDAMEGGVWAQRGKQFQLRVTLAVGARDKVIEKQAITPAMMEPAVPT